MKKLLRTCLLASAFLYLGPIYGGMVYAEEPKCKLTETQLRLNVASRKPKYFGAYGVVLSKLLTVLNRQRTLAGLGSYEGDKLLLAIMGMSPNPNTVYVGFAIFKNGCYVAGNLMAYGDWKDVAAEAGVAPQDMKSE